MISPLILFASVATVLGAAAREELSPKQKVEAAVLRPLIEAELHQRDTDDAYAPFEVSCPATNSTSNFITKANALHPDEKAWLDGRKSKASAALQDWLNKSNLTDFNVGDFFGTNGTDIRVAMAFSGGGYRAMLAGAGQMAATDNRTTNSTKSGHMGGLLQAATYVAGLSGGNWLLGSVVVNNFTSVQALQHSDDTWDLSENILNPGGINIFKTGNYWVDIGEAVNAKKDANFNTSITDIWGRALSYQFFSDYKHGGVSLHYNYVRNYTNFTNYDTFFPIHVADGRAPNTRIISLNSTVFEFTPFVMGSWDPSVYSFTDLQYLGTNVSAGQPKSDTCINGYDNVGFVIGTSSSLFNQFILQINDTTIGSTLKAILTDILADIGDDNDDIAVYSPNPFADLDYVASSIKSAEWLDLVDGGEDGQNIPLHPLIQPQREVDIVFAFDNSADTSADSPLGANWANGTSLVASYQRQFGAQANGTIFPYVPDQDTFVYGGWALQPTFFGCSIDNMTSLFDSSIAEADRVYPPVLVYIANSLHSGHSNTSTFTMSYDTEDVAMMIENGYNTFTQNNGTIDSEWRTCVACAVVLREQQRRGESPTEQCQKCFSQYCWDGSTVSNTSVTPARRDGKSNIDSALSSSLSASASKNSAPEGVAVAHGSMLLLVFALFTQLL